MPYRDSGRGREYQREYGRMRRVGEAQTPGQTVVPIPFRLKTAADVLALLGEQVAAVRADPAVGTLERARCIGYLAGVTLKAIEAGDLAARVEAVGGDVQGAEGGVVTADGLAKHSDKPTVDERFRLRLHALVRGDR